LNANNRLEQNGLQPNNAEKRSWRKMQNELLITGWSDCYRIKSSFMPFSGWHCISQWSTRGSTDMQRMCRSRFYATSTKTHVFPAPALYHAGAVSVIKP